MELTDYKGDLKRQSMPIRTKKIHKLGTVRHGTVETTPIVWQDRLLLLEWIRPHIPVSNREAQENGYFRFYDIQMDEEVGVPFAKDHAFGCAYTENGVMYVAGVRRLPEDNAQGNTVDLFVSDDLIHWDCHTAITLPSDLRLAFNTSICKGENGYVMVIEVSGPKEVTGSGFSVIFARSEDLLHWELLPYDRHLFFKERYTACPTVRYYDGFYYIVYLEMLPLFRLMPYIVRTADFNTFEPGFYNPFMIFDDEDKSIAFPDRMTQKEVDFIQNAVNVNASDVDFCDYNGKTMIMYSWGNQLGTEFLAMAEYDGTLKELLQSYFLN